MFCGGCQAAMPGRTEWSGYRLGQLFGWLLCFPGPISSEENNALILATPSTSNWVEVPFSHALLCPGPYRTVPKPSI